MFKFLRVSILLYILAFVAVGTFVTDREARQWNRPLQVRIYGTPGDDSPAVMAQLATLGAEDFEALQQLFSNQASRYGIEVEPFEFDLDMQTLPTVPAIPTEPSWLNVMSWSLRMRWLVMRLDWQRDGYAPDITVFAVYHDAGEPAGFDRSTALRKGMIAVANVFADSDYAGSNAVVIGHELLHTLGATDKYIPTTNQPRFPEGYAAPQASPRYPQAQAELMAGRRPLSPTSAETPRNLREVTIGHQTAAEIGWIRP